MPYNPCTAVVHQNHQSYYGQICNVRRLILGCIKSRHNKKCIVSSNSKLYGMIRRDFQSSVKFHADSGRAALADRGRAAGFRFGGPAARAPAPGCVAPRRNKSTANISPKTLPNYFAKIWKGFVTTKNLF